MTDAYTNQPGERLDLPSPNVAMRGKGTTGMEYQIIGTTLHELGDIAREASNWPEAIAYYQESLTHH